MSTSTTRRPAAAVSFESTTSIASVYTPDTTNSQTLIAQAIDCIINGRAFPEHLRPTVFAASPRPATVQEGIARILNG